MSINLSQHGSSSVAVPTGTAVPAYRVTKKVQKMRMKRTSSNGSQQHVPAAWHYDAENGFLLATKAGLSQLTVPAGVYNPYITENGLALRSARFDHDDLVSFDDDLSSKIAKEISTFMDSAAKFEQYGLVHRRGFMLYGPTGSGKSCIVYQAISKTVNEGNIVLMCDNPGILSHAVGEIREREPDRLVTCVFEDLDSLIDNCGDDDILSFLDGEDQHDHVLSIATTNYPEKLDKRIVARPRRFDRVIRIGYPHAEIRRSYFHSKLLNTTPEILDKWVGATDTFSFAAMAELIISVECLGNTFESAVASLTAMQKLGKTGEDDPWKDLTTTEW